MTNGSTPPAESIEFPLSELEAGVANAIPLQPAPPKWAAFNALRHLNCAWKIRSLDPEMAVFRSITAEEEAATALFRSVRRRGYNGAEALDTKSHTHKNAVIPFLSAVGRACRPLRSQISEVKFVLDKAANPPRLSFHLGVVHPQTGEQRWAAPTPPLEFSLLRESDGGLKAVIDFEDHMHEIVSEFNVASTRTYLRRRSNLRNQMLYASEQGRFSLPEDTEAILTGYRENVFAMLKLYLLIDPYPQRQSFVSQGLVAFLKLVGGLPEELESEWDKPVQLPPTKAS